MLSRSKLGFTLTPARCKLGLSLGETILALRHFVIYCHASRQGLLDLTGASMRPHSSIAALRRREGEGLADSESGDLCPVG